MIKFVDYDGEIVSCKNFSTLLRIMENNNMKEVKIISMPFVGDDIEINGTFTYAQIDEVRR